MKATISEFRNLFTGEDVSEYREKKEIKEIMHVFKLAISNYRTSHNSFLDSLS